MSGPVSADQSIIPWGAEIMRKAAEQAIPAVTSTSAGWPRTPMTTRELTAAVKLHLDIVTNQRDAMHPYLWANHVVALGKLVTAERAAILKPSVWHNIGTRRQALLQQFVAHWDSIA